MFFINNVKWKVVLVSPNYHKLFRSDNSLSLAVCDNEEKTIYISKEVKGRKFKKVLCHEITHAAMFSYSIDLTIEQEELLADLIATYGEEIIEITNKLFTKMIEGLNY